MWPPTLAWWVYVILALTVFIGFISLNYIVKKMNETRIEERFLRLSQKAPTGQATQVHFPLIQMETGRTVESTVMSFSDDLDPTGQGISLVFDKEKNLLNEKKTAIEEDLMQQVEEMLARKEDDVAIIKNSESNSDSDKNTDSESKIDVIMKPTFLGNIYKSANNSVCNYRVNRDNDQDSILNDMLDEMMSKVNDVKSVKSTSSVMKCNMPKNYKGDRIFNDIHDEITARIDVKSDKSTSSVEKCNVPENNKEETSILNHMLDQVTAKVDAKSVKSSSSVIKCNVPENNKEEDSILNDMLDEVTAKADAKSIKSSSSIKKFNVPENNKKEDSILNYMLDQITAKAECKSVKSVSSVKKCNVPT